jgi:DNA-binding CsgD family transcriptional regulator
MVQGIQECRLDTIVDRFYEAAAQPDLWRSLLHDAGEVFGGVGAILLPGPKAPVAAVWSKALDEGVQIGMRDGWYANNPRVLRGVPALKHSQDVITEQDLFTPDELRKLPFNAEFITGTGMGSFAGLILAPDGPASVILSLERSLYQEPFSRAELATIGRIVPQLQRAGQLALKMADARLEGTLDGLEMLACGGMLLDSIGQVLRLNSKAEAVLRKGGLSLSHKQLSSSDKQANTKLQELIGSTLRFGSSLEATVRGPVAVPRPGQYPLLVHAAPVVGSARDLFQRGKAILMLVDPDEHREPAEPVLRQAFGLTPAEARIALALTRGQNVEEIASTNGVSKGTVRTQLKTILAKSGTRRQAELIALLGRMSAR